MIKLRSKRLFRSSSKLSTGGATHGDGGAAIKGCKVNGGEIKWELRPGGMLVQKRDYKVSDNEVMITIKVSTVSQWHDISVQATSTFGKSEIRNYDVPFHGRKFFILSSILLRKSSRWAIF